MKLFAFIFFLNTINLLENNFQKLFFDLSHKINTKKHSKSSFDKYKNLIQKLKNNFA